MFKTMILVMLALTTLVVAAEPAPTLFEGVESAAGKAVTTFHHGINNADQQQVLRILDPKLMVFEGAGVERSKTEYASHHLAADIKFMAAMTITAIEQHVITEGNMAFSIGKNHMQGRYNNKDYDFVSTESLSLHLVQGVWLINYIHWSN